jgi:protein-tyrosine-phosphatase
MSHDDARIAVITKALNGRFDGVLDDDTIARYAADSYVALHRTTAHADPRLPELGVSLDGAYPKPITHDMLRAVDVVVIAGGDDAVPRLPGPGYETWDLPHPPGSDLDGVRAVRDNIDRRVGVLLHQVTTDPGVAR